MLAGDESQRQPGKIRMMPHQAGRQQPVALREYLRETVINSRQQSQTQPEGKDPIYQRDELS